MAPSTTLIPRLVSVVEIIKREYVKKLDPALAEKGCLAGLHQYNEVGALEDLSDEHLRFHTIQQAIDDFEYFAKNVKLPQPDGDSVKPGQAPWVLIGGSYAGALASFTMVKCVRVNLCRVRGV